MKPNLFEIATSELSQDGFFSWLISWADPECKKSDKNLHDTAIDFLKLLTEKEDLNIKNISIERQYKNIDILVKINDEYVIAIEDKTHTETHSNQLGKYRKTIEDNLKNVKNKIFIYLKTGNESKSKLKYIREIEKYKPITRKDVLDILEKSKSNNDILKDFTKHLRHIENETNKTKLDSITQSHLSAQGFYLFLQEELEKRKIPPWSDWGYVSNSSGGFLGFWYHFLGLDKENNKDTNIEIYIQIQNSFENGIQLVVKLNGGTNLDQLYSTLKLLKEIGQKFNLNIVKPSRYRTGETSTVAIVENAFENSENGFPDSFLIILKKLEQVLDKLQEKNRNID